MGLAGQCMGFAARWHTGCRDRKRAEAPASGWARCRGRAWDALHIRAGRHDREIRYSAGVRTMVHRTPDGRAGTDAARTYAARSYAAPGAAIGRHVLHVVARRQRGARQQRERVERQRGARRQVHERHGHAQARCVWLSCSVVLRAQAWWSVFLNRAACCTASCIHCR
jgi:hypothetical protein